MEQEQGVLVSPSAEVPVVEGEMVTAIRELTNRGWGARAIAAAWEGGYRRPALANIARIVAFLGYDPKDFG